MKKKKIWEIIFLSSMVLLCFFLYREKIEIQAAVKGDELLKGNAPIITEGNITLYEGYKSHQIKVDNTEKGAEISFTSSNKEVAKVYKFGTVKPLKQGKTTITVTIKQSGNVYSQKVSVTVKAPYIFINNKVENVKIGEKYGFRVQLMGSSTKDEDIQWEVSDEDIASITQEGKTAILTAKKSGKVRVLVRDTKKGKTSVCHVQVTKDSVLFEFINPTKTLWCDVDYKLQVRGNRSSLTWSVSDESIAKITQEGVITGLTQGTVTVSALDPLTGQTITTTIQTKKIEETPVSELEYSVVNRGETSYICLTGVKNKEIKQLNIPEMIEGKPVYVLGDEALWRLENLEVLVIPKTLQSLTDSLAYLPKLETIVVLNRTESFGLGQFSGGKNDCPNLKEYIMPYEMDWSFPYNGSVSNFSNVKQFVLPEGNNEELGEVFSKCSNMEIVLPESLKRLEYGFTDCNNIRVIIPRSVEEMAEYDQIFWGSTEVTIVTPRGSYAESYAKKYNLSYENYYD